MTTKSLKIDFSKRETALNLSADWFDLGGGLYAAKVGKEASKALFTSKRAAGREFIVIDTKARAITAKDTLADLSGFQKADKAAILATASYEKRPKSKSRARLEASRAAIKTLDKEAADFTAFCKQINAGRKAPYSERNCALLYDQSNGAATCVKGFQSWKAAGRVVKKGAKALVIEAPKMIKGTDKSGEEYEHLICTPVCVFDISQTEELVKEGA